jgi:hypothetical protein
LENKSLQYKSLRYVLEDGIIIGTYLETTSLDIDMAQKGVEMRRALSNNSAMPLLMDISNLKGASAEARQYLASTESLSEVRAGALLVKSIFSEALGNFFFAVSKPIIPKKIFTDKNKAIAWLNQFNEIKPIV